MPSVLTHNSSIAGTSATSIMRRERRCPCRALTSYQYSVQAHRPVPLQRRHIRGRGKKAFLLVWHPSSKPEQAGRSSSATATILHVCPSHASASGARRWSRGRQIIIIWDQSGQLSPQLTEGPSSFRAARVTPPASWNNLWTVNAQKNVQGNPGGAKSG